MSTEINNFQALGKAKGIKLVHMNVRSLFPKVDQLRAILFQNKIDILTLSETWLNSKYDDHMIQIQDYTHYRLDRSNGKDTKKTGGGK